MTTSRVGCGISVRLLDPVTLAKERISTLEIEKVDQNAFFSLKKGQPDIP